MVEPSNLHQATLDNMAPDERKFIDSVREYINIQNRALMADTKFSFNLVVYNFIPIE